MTDIPYEPMLCGLTFLEILERKEFWDDVGDGPERDAVKLAAQLRRAKERIAADRAFLAQNGVTE